MEKKALSNGAGHGKRLMDERLLGKKGNQLACSAASPLKPLSRVARTKARRDQRKNYGNSQRSKRFELNRGRGLRGGESYTEKWGSLLVKERHRLQKVHEKGVKGQWRCRKIFLKRFTEG